MFLIWGVLPIALAASQESEIDFATQIKPILSDRCYVCHGPDAGTREADLRLDTEEGAEYVLEKGDPDESELLRRIETDDEDEIMPPHDSNLSLTDAEKKTIRQWIKQGAKWQQHWAFVAPTAPNIPIVDDQTLVVNEIDSFIVHRLQQNKLHPAPLASKEKLIRRVTFDLTGLPPTLSEIDSFLADDSSEAYANVVDRLLASPRYGERMASDWLDVARYSDTYGYQVDRDRFVWPWRDWVVRAFNENKSYDQFVTEQLAGDLLANATDDQILATTFNRLHPQKVEGGSVEEEFRVEYVADRSQTVGMALMGLTVECARCHDHKYDPLSQKEYYELFAFFNNIDESGLYSYFDAGAIPTPTLLLQNDGEKKKLVELHAELKTAEEKLQQSKLNLEKPFEDFIADYAAREKIADDLTISGEVFAADFKTTKNARNKIINGPDDQTAVQLTGDDEIKLSAGKFSRTDPFSIAARIKIPPQPENKLIERNVIFHRSRAWTDSASRGYQLLIENGRLNASLIHFWPGNAISVQTVDPVSTDKWIHVTMTYDGSSRAAGLQIFIDGKPQQLEIVKDHLQKTISGSGTDHLIIGARFRDRGFTDGEIADLKVFDRTLTEIETRELNDGQSLSKLLRSPGEKLDQIQRDQLLELFAATKDEACQQQQKTVRDVHERIAQSLDSQKEIMVMRELDSPRPAFVLNRGSYDAPTDPVSAGTPAVFPKLRKSADRPANRLDLARWLTSGDHPLTSRVAVNRLWQLCFGQGLVPTPEDFGSQGSPPTHPDLLDWLAVDLQIDWDIKRSLKQIVMSRTYRQSTVASEELLRIDPDNELLARAPTYRLPAEMLRDNLLALSGLLVEKIGGPPVRPYELAAAFKPATPDQGEGLYRRSLYTFWQRTGPAPVMLTLDAAKRDVCQVKRERTSSPLQALVLLNGPQFVEASRKLAESLMDNAKGTHEIATDLFRSLTGRRPTTDELEIIETLYEKQLAVFKSDEKAVDELLAVGATKSETKQRTELAAWTTVANALMNFDECVMKR